MQPPDAPPVQRDAKDWTWVLDRPCPECGFVAATLAAADIGARTRLATAQLRAAMDGPDATVRPQPTTWSPLEYGCHVRDVCRIYLTRLQLMLAENDPLFANWDQDETALAERYWEQQPAQARGELDEAAAVIAAAFDQVAGDQWQRTGRRSDGATFTVLTLGQYFVHDLVHHVHDIRG